MAGTLFLSTLVLFNLLAIGLLLALAVKGVKRIRKNIRFKNRRMMIERMKRDLSATNVRLRIHRSSNKITGVWKETDVLEAESEYLREIADDDSKKCGRILLKVDPTFTFAGRFDIKRPIHTGVINDLKRFDEEFVKIVTGQDLKGFTPRERDEILGVIYTKESRVFIPSIGPKSGSSSACTRAVPTTRKGARVYLFGMTGSGM